MVKSEEVDMINKKATQLPGLRCNHCGTKGGIKRRKLRSGQAIYMCGICGKFFSSRMMAQVEVEK